MMPEQLPPPIPEAPGPRDHLEPAPRPAPLTGATRCPECGGTGGTHRLVHTRHGNGGGSNHPCSHAKADR